LYDHSLNLRVVDIDMPTKCIKDRLDDIVDIALPSLCPENKIRSLPRVLA